MKTIVLVPTKRLRLAQLKAELIEAGIPDWPGPLTDAEPVGSGLITLSLPDESDLDVAMQVIEAHKDERTVAEAKREQSASALGADDPTTIRLRAIVRVLYASLTETRTWCNQMRQQLEAAGMPTPPRLQNRTWDEAMQAVLAQINAEVPDDPIPGAVVPAKSISGGVR